MKKRSLEKGFTVVEVMVVIVVLIVLATFFVVQRDGLEKANRDEIRKQAINSMYYALVEGFYEENGYYPRTISREQLPTVDPTLFTDPSGLTLNGDVCVYTNDDDEQQTDGQCEYHYSASNCDSDGKCQQFTLTADMETEADYQKKSEQ